MRNVTQTRARASPHDRSALPPPASSIETPPASSNAGGGKPRVARKTDTPAALAQALRGGERRALARMITLLESSRRDLRLGAEEALDLLLPHAGGSLRLGISGTPGAGKSSFIEAFGLTAIERGHKVAVLAVDPSSCRGGGAILGDKTRMERLARAPQAFIRPSPSGGGIGGVARATREASMCCEAAGYDLVLIETVGVGQSETDVHGMADMFLLLLAPGGGDDLQGLKRGVMEIADLVLINKSDGDFKAAAGRAARDCRAALSLMRPPRRDWTPEVLTVSALEGRGIEETWRRVEAFRHKRVASGALSAWRASQARNAMWRDISAGFLEAVRGDARLNALARDLEARVVSGELPPWHAAARFHARLFGELRKKP